MEKLRISKNSFGHFVSRLDHFFIKNLHFVGLIFCILFAVQFFYLNDLSRLGFIIDPDTRGYIYPAFQALEGHGLTLIYSRPFVYPLMLAIAGYLTGGIEYVIYVHFFIFFATCYVIYLTCLNVAQFIQTNFDTKISYYFNFTFSLLFCYLFYASGYQLYMVSSARPEIFTSFISVFLLYLISKQLNSNTLSVKVSLSILVVIFSSLLMFTTQKWSFFVVVVVAISQYILYANLNSLKKYSLYAIVSGAIFAGIFMVNFNLVNKYDAQSTKIFGPTVLFCSNLDIIASNIQKKNYAEFDAKLLGDIVNLYNQSVSSGGYQRLGFNIDFCLYNQTENVVVVLARHNIVDYEDVKNVLDKISFDSIANNLDLYFYRILKQIFVPITDIFDMSFYSIDSNYTIDHVNDKQTLLDLSNNDRYHAQFINSSIVSDKMHYIAPKALFFVKFVMDYYLIIFAILNIIVVLSFLISRNLKKVAIYALLVIVYGVTVLPVAMTHSFDVGRYIINAQQIIFVILLSLLVLTKSAVSDILRKKNPRYTNRH